MSLAQRLIRRPRLPVDEPTSALDLRRQLNLLILLDLMEAYARDADALVVVVLHDAARYAETLLLRDGRFVGAGLPREVLGRDLVRDVYAEVLLTAAGHPVVAPLAAWASPPGTDAARPYDCWA